MIPVVWDCVVVEKEHIAIQIAWRTQSSFKAARSILNPRDIHNSEILPTMALH